MEFPPELLQDAPDEKERAARRAKWLVMQELRVDFSEKVALKIARDEIPTHGFIGGLRKNWSSKHANNEGLSRGDIEVTADYLGVFDDIWPVEVSSK